MIQPPPFSKLKKTLPPYLINQASSWTKATMPVSSMINLNKKSRITIKSYRNHIINTISKMKRLQMSSINLKSKTNPPASSTYLTMMTALMTGINGKARLPLISGKCLKISLTVHRSRECRCPDPLLLLKEDQ